MFSIICKVIGNHTLGGWAEAWLFWIPLRVSYRRGVSWALNKLCSPIEMHICSIADIYTLMVCVIFS